MRRQVSALLDAGHAQAREYPIGMVWDEHRLVVSRQNAMEATRATLLKMAVSAVLAKDAGREFRKTIQEMNDED